MAEWTVVVDSEGERAQWQVKDSCHRPCAFAAVTT